MPNQFYNGVVVMGTYSFSYSVSTSYNPYNYVMGTCSVSPYTHSTQRLTEDCAICNKKISIHEGKSTIVTSKKTIVICKECSEEQFEKLIIVSEI